MKINYIRITLLSLLLLVFAGSTQAATLVMDGAINQLTYDTNDTSKDTISVDYWHFSVESAGMVTIDVLSWERHPDEWYWVDVNGDGEDSFIDSSIHVFRDGLLAENIYASNDDSALGRDDGTIRGNDSFLSQEFEAGDYIIAISSCGYSPWFSVDEAVAGVNEKAIIPYASGEGAHGDYRITVTGDSVSAVPVPAAIWLFTSGLVGLAGFRRRK